MLPTIAIIGRPNVGKSTLFNRLTRSQDAIVADIPGVTRDRQYGYALLDNRLCLLIDTGGLGEETHAMDKVVVQQSLLAIQEADLVLFVVDARAGLTIGDQEIVQMLRQSKKDIFLVINKMEGLQPELMLSDFYQLGMRQLYPIAAAHGQGISNLIEAILTKLPPSISAEISPQEGIKLAIVGKPNVGKSTLVNRMLGEERVIVFDQPGTTRSSIYVPLERQGQKYVLIDTAGIRRQTKITDTIEKFSVVKTLQSITEADVVIFLIDARENISQQDLRLLDFVVEAGKGLVLAINKWDGLTDYQRERVRTELDRRLDLVNYAKMYFISALHGTGVGDLFASVVTAYKSNTIKPTTSELTSILERAIEAHQPPLGSGGRRIKLRYAHPGGTQPPTIIVHGKQTKALPGSYQRFLVNFFRKALGLEGTPIRLKLQSDENPYAEE